MILTLPQGYDTPIGQDGAKLSGGQRQRVMIAMALANGPELLIADEPTTALSSRETERLFALVRQLRAEGIALIYISHRMAEIFALADRHGLEIHPLAVRALIRNARHAARLRGDPEANAIFLDLLTGRDAAVWLRMMNETGFLSRFMPEWWRIVGLMQFDTYHVFTVDEHTIEAIGVLGQLTRGELAETAPVASELIGQIQSRRALYAAALLHTLYRRPTPQTGHRLYRYSIAFPYVAGTVAGVQLVAAISLGAYP